MRLVQFLSEAEEQLQSIEDIKRLCPKTYKGRNLFNLYRGMQPRFLIGKKDIRTDRIPKDSHSLFHELLNKGFKDVFGKNLRSESLFCTGKLDQAAKYGGNICRIFPADKFTVYWSDRIKDAWALTTVSPKALNTDNLDANAFIFIWCLLVFADYIKFLQFKHALPNLQKAIDLIFPSFEDAIDFSDEFENREYRPKVIKRVLTVFPNAPKYFVKTFYRSGTTIDDLRKACLSNSEIMITAPFYCYIADSEGYFETD